MPEPAVATSPPAESPSPAGAGARKDTGGRARGARAADPLPGTPSAYLGIPLSLSTRIARGVATLRAVREAREGTLFLLETPIGEPAELITEGAVLGRGEIVEIKHRLWLRLTSLGERKDG